MLDNVPPNQNIFFALRNVLLSMFLWLLYFRIKVNKTALSVKDQPKKLNGDKLILAP